EFKIDISGFWKQLPIDHVGTDKKGRPIHGRTWVQKTLTWVESKDSQPVSVQFHKLGSQEEKRSEGSSKSGVIYVMRSPAHAKDIFKIGLSSRSGEIRADELSRSTGSPDKFLIVQEWEV